MSQANALKRFTGAVAIAGLLAGCAARPGPEVLTPMPAARGGERISLYAATNRAAAPGSNTTFTSTRSDELRYARYVISVPPTHRHGEIEWPKGKADPAANFVTVAAAPTGETVFRDQASQSRDGSVALFVHGYNYSFQESVYRLAQLAADAKSASTRSLFAWPSKADLLSYRADQKAAAASREQLAQVIDMLGRRPRARVVLFAHSMGAWLTMEALVKLRQERRDAVFGKLQDVVLAAPDISPEDFVRQLSIVRRLPVPITLLVSKDDEALALSRLLQAARTASAAPTSGSLSFGRRRSGSTCGSSTSRSSRRSRASTTTATPRWRRSIRSSGINLSGNRSLLTRAPAPSCSTPARRGLRGPIEPVRLFGTG